MSSETVSDERLKLWFFRDLSSEQRLGLFRLMEMPVDEIGQTHGHQQIAFNQVLQSLRSKPVASGVEVKPLEWLQDDANEWGAASFVGHYSIVRDDVDLFSAEGTQGHLSLHGTLEEAKAAAEADYRNRITSALLPKATAPVVSDEMVERAMNRFYYDAPRVMHPVTDDELEDYNRFSEDMRAALQAALGGSDA